MRFGHISKYVTYIPGIGPDSKRYREWQYSWGNEEQIDYHIKKIVHGPKQEGYWEAKYDRVGKRIVPDNREKIVIKKFMIQTGTL